MSDGREVEASTAVHHVNGAVRAENRPKSGMLQIANWSQKGSTAGRVAMHPRPHCGDRCEDTPWRQVFVKDTPPRPWLKFESHPVRTFDGP